MKFSAATTTTSATKQDDSLLRNKRTISRSIFHGVVILAVYVIVANVSQVNHLGLTFISDRGEREVIYYYFPSEPMYHIHSILNASIGTKILSDPQRNPLRNCSPTVQYRLRIPRQTVAQTEEETTWVLQSMMMIESESNDDHIDKNKPHSNRTKTQIIPKSYGGDEIYVQWEADPNTTNTNSNNYDYMGIAHVTDQEDGTYLLKFKRPPMLQFNYTKQQEMRDRINFPNSINENMIQYGQLTIFYEYTCGIGSIFAPNKDQYTRGGEVYQTLTSNTATPSSSSLSFSPFRRKEETTQFVPRPYIHDFVPPNTAIVDASSSHALTISNTNATNELIDLSKYDSIFAFGDSLIMQLVRRYLRKGQWSDNIIWYRNVFQCLSTENDARSMLYKFHTQHGEQIRNLTKQSKRIALLTGSSSWDAMRGCVHEDMKDHVNAIRKYILNVTTTFPNVDIYWKAPSAFFLHRYTTYIEAFNDTYFRTLKPKYGVKPLKPRYINYHVPQQLYHVQKELMMRELNIPFLDLYESYYLSAPWTVPGDSRHFDDAFTRLQLSYFWPGLLNKPIYT